MKLSRTNHNLDSKTFRFPIFRRSSERDRPSTSCGTTAAEAAAVAASSAAIVVSQASSDRHTTTAASGSGAAAADSVSNREVFRWRDRQYYGPKRWLESALRDSTWQDKDDSNDAKKSASTGENNTKVRLFLDRSG